MIGSGKVCTIDQGIVSLDPRTALGVTDQKILYLELLVPVLAMARGEEEDRRGGGGEGVEDRGVTVAVVS